MASTIVHMFMLLFCRDARFKYSLLRADPSNGSSDQAINDSEWDSSDIGANLVSQGSSIAQTGGYTGLAIQQPDRPQRLLPDEPVAVHGLLSKPQLKAFHEDSDVDMLD